MEWLIEAGSLGTGVIGIIAGGFAFYIKSAIMEQIKDFRSGKEIDADMDHQKRNLQMADQALQRGHDALKLEVADLGKQVVSHQVTLDHMGTSVVDLKSTVKELDKNVQAVSSKLDTSVAVHKTQHEQTITMLTEILRDKNHKGE